MPKREVALPTDQQPMSLMINTSNSSQTLGLLSETSFTQLVNDAFRQYQSTLALSRSPLANSALVTPTLVLDDASPTAEERGRGLRLVLRWAVEQIAPGAVVYPLGEFRPFDDPTWSDPLWWRYNILRHRYLEPLHPDDFVEGGRYTETLMALTGITSSDALFDERNRAIRAVAAWLRQQLVDGRANAVLQQMALAEAVIPLQSQRDAASILGIAAIFDEIFPRSLLMRMAATAQIPAAEQVLDYLLTNRLLLAGDSGANLWLSATLRSYIYQQQSPEALQRCHRVAAHHYAGQNAALTAAKHWLQAGFHQEAIRLLFDAAETLIHELQVADLIHVLQRFHRTTLADSIWRELQILLSDLYHRSGQPEDALSACRSALKVSMTPLDQARIYRRMGKLYVTRNQLHALAYYQQAAERFEPTNPELADLLKDRGWLHILRRNWEAAEQDLRQALAILQSGNAELQADVLDALASLYRRQKRFEIALDHARQALALREHLGNLPRIASSFNNLGNIYRHMGEYWQAISAYEEALVTYRKLDNQESIAGALMNIGSSYFSLEQLEDAIRNYQQCLTICTQLQQPHVEATAHYNLAEAYAAMQRQSEAIAHWQQGYELSQRAGFADEVNAFEQLRAETPLLQSAREQQVASPAIPQVITATRPRLPMDEQRVLDLAQQYGRITAKMLTEQLAISRATATRRLTTLTEAGHLQQQGKGRGTHYTLVDAGIRGGGAWPISQTAPGSSAPSNPLTTLADAEIEGQLARLQVALAERFAVAAITPIPPPPGSTMPRLTVRFTEIPTLPEFCALRAYLTEVLESEVDLWPEI